MPLFSLFARSGLAHETETSIPRSREWLDRLVSLVLLALSLAAWWLASL